MRIIGKSILRDFGRLHPSAKTSLERFEAIAEASAWKTFAEMKRTAFISADQVKAGSGLTLQVIDIKGNQYRLIVAINFKLALVQIREFLPHDQYMKNRWPEKAESIFDCD